MNTMLILFICLFSRLPDISWHAHEQNRGGRKVPADAMWAPPVFTWNTDCSQPWCPLNVSAPFWWLTLHRHGPSVHKQDIHRNNLHILAMKTLLLVICWGFAGSSQTPGQASVMHEETLNWSCGVITVTKPALAPSQERAALWTEMSTYETWTGLELLPSHPQTARQWPTLVSYGR